MRRSLVALAALAGAATFTLAAPANAFAGGAGEIEVSPMVVQPGHTITLSTEDCKGEAHVSVTIDGVKHGIELEKKTSEGITGTFRVPKDTDNGRFDVEGTCENTGRELEGHFFVKSGPSGGPSAGLGGSVAGMSVSETAGGATLATAAAAGGLVLLRRRRLQGRA
jgi:hypothetical protein